MPDLDNETTLAEDVALLSSDDQEPQSDDEPEQTLESDETLPSEEQQTQEESEEKLEEQEEEEKEVLPETSLTYDRPTIRQITTAYPDFFKKFPSLKDVYFREAEFTKIFPTVDDAREAVTNAEAFSEFRESALRGEPSALLDAIREADPQALDRFAVNILPSLHKLSPETHWQAVLPLLENVTRSLYKEGMDLGDTDRGKDLMNAARYLSKFLFGETEIAEGKKTNVKAPEKSSREIELDEREKNYEIQRYTDAYRSVDADASKGLSDLILERGQHNKLKIDPDGVMSDFMKNSVADAISAEVRKAMRADKVFTAHMNSLWKKAKELGYTSESKSRILSAYLERAKQLVPSIRNRKVAEALGTSEGKPNGAPKPRIARREPGTGGGEGRGGNRIPRANEVDWTKTSDEDFLNDRVTLRK